MPKVTQLERSKAVQQTLGYVTPKPVLHSRGTCRQFYTMGNAHFIDSASNPIDIFHDENILSTYSSATALSGLTGS